MRVRWWERPVHRNRLSRIPPRDPVRARWTGQRVEHRAPLPRAQRSRERAGVRPVVAGGRPAGRAEARRAKAGTRSAFARSYGGTSPDRAEGRPAAIVRVLTEVQPGCVDTARFGRVRSRKNRRHEHGALSDPARCPLLMKQPADYGEGDEFLECRVEREP